MTKTLFLAGPGKRTSDAPDVNSIDNLVTKTHEYMKEPVYIVAQFMRGLLLSKPHWPHLGNSAVSL